LTYIIIPISGHPLPLSMAPCILLGTVVTRYAGTHTSLSFSAMPLRLPPYIAAVWCRHLALLPDVVERHLALHSSTAALLSSFLRLFPVIFFTAPFLMLALESSKELHLCKWLPNEKFSSYNSKHHPKQQHTIFFLMKLYFRGLSSTGRKIFNFLYRPRLLAGTVQYKHVCL
jgi:hypothetical protein